MKFRSLRNHDLQRDLDDELRSHIEMKAADLEATGMSPADALREAHLRFGNVTALTENTRDLHVFSLLEDLYADLRFGWRRLRREPAFTLTAVLTLGLVIGANGTIFSVLEAVLLRPLPFTNPSELVILYGSDKQSARQPIPVADLEDFRTAHSLSALVAEQTQSVNLTGVEEPGRLIGSFVSPEYFPTLGIQPAKGRSFTADEGRVGGPRVCLLSNPVWKNRFGADERVLGRTLILNAEPYVVIGILPETYRPTFTNAEVWLPVHFYPNYSRDRGRANVTGIGRLAPGVTLSEARAELATIAASLAAQFPATNRDRGVTVLPANEVVQGNSRPALYVLTGAVACVLLLGCANIAGLLLTKAAGRKGEMAIRASVGASRSRLVRQMLTESVLLAVLGGALGLVVAYGGMNLLVIYCADLVSAVDLEINRMVLSFLVLISLSTGILFGLAPALFARRETATTLRQRGVGSAQGSFRSVLVAAEVALALVLLVCSGLMVKTALNTASIDPGFRGEHVLTMEYRIPRTQYSEGGQQTQFHHEVIARVSALPGVRSAGIVGALPFSGNSSGNRTKITLPDRPEPPADMPLVIQANTATPFYFATAGIPLLAGRDFQLGDGPDSQQVAIVSRSFVTRFWPDGDPLGRQIYLPESKRVVTVVGVVGDTKHDSLYDPESAELYRPYAQSPFIFATLAVRTAGDPLAATKAVQRAIWSIDPNQPMWKIRTLQFLVDRSFSVQRYVSWLLVAFATLALGLAAIGLYGVLAYGVSQRTAEFGVRMALGATPSNIVGLVVRKGLMLTFGGVVAGLVAALLVAQFLKGQIFGVRPNDPALYMFVSIVLLTVATAAVLLPARRAMRVDPLTAIRQE